MRGGKRKGAGRPPSGDPVRNMTIAPKESERAALQAAAARCGKSVSRFVIDAAMKEAMSIVSTGQ